MGKLMHNVTIGARREQTLLVTTENCINFMGDGGARVLSTPHMIGWMERTCRDLALAGLDPGHDTVGTRVNVSHLAAAGIGDVVTFSAEVAGYADRRIDFRVEARTAREKIGEGTHERAIVNVAKFAARMAEKKS
jgi:fluoroacetyl-CoA thioesterase